MHSKFGVLGAGSWGTALALQLAANQHEVKLWSRHSETGKKIQTARENVKYLPGIRFPDNLNMECALAQILSSCEYLLIAVPSQAVRELLDKISPLPNSIKGIMWATKGLEHDTGKFIHQVVEEKLGADILYGVLSGPSFAIEVAKKLPTAVTIAANRIDYAQQLAVCFHSAAFRIYTSTDVLGIEIGGAVKNILAIAAGIIDGLHYGVNARAALITRGVAELIRFGAKLGADPKTLMGLSGLGDVVLSCTDNTSRNRRLGIALAEGMSQEQFRNQLQQTVEGIHAAKSVRSLALQHNIDMPICEQVYYVLFEALPPQQAVKNLLIREIKQEFYE